MKVVVKDRSVDISVGDFEVYLSLNLSRGIIIDALEAKLYEVMQHYLEKNRDLLEEAGELFSSYPVFYLYCLEKEYIGIFESLTFVYDKRVVFGRLIHPLFINTKQGEQEPIVFSSDKMEVVSRGSSLFVDLDKAVKVMPFMMMLALQVDVLDEKSARWVVKVFRFIDGNRNAVEACIEGTMRNVSNVCRKLEKDMIGKPELVKRIEVYVDPSHGRHSKLLLGIDNVKHGVITGEVLDNLLEGISKYMLEHVIEDWLKILSRINKCVEKFMYHNRKLRR